MAGSYREVRTTAPCPAVNRVSIPNRYQRKRRQPVRRVVRDAAEVDRVRDQVEPVDRDLLGGARVDE